MAPRTTPGACPGFESRSFERRAASSLSLLRATKWKLFRSATNPFSCCWTPALPQVNARSRLVPARRLLSQLQGLARAPYPQSSKPTSHREYITTKYRDILQPKLNIAIPSLEMGHLINRTNSNILTSEFFFLLFLNATVKKVNFSKQLGSVAQGLQR